MDDLLIKYLLGEATPEETGRVDRWLSEDERHRERYRQFRTTWEISGRSGLSAMPEAHEALQRFRHRLITIDPAPSVAVDFSWRIAAILAGAVCIGAATWFTIRPRAPIPEGSLSIRGGNDVLTDSLPDGSKVTLNRHATIAFPTKWKEGFNTKSKDARSVRLEGEAFFSIAPDPARPFVVLVNDLTVTVLGTSFNIRSQAGNSSQPGSTEIVVESGAVLVSRAGDSLVLHSGEKLSTINRAGGRRPGSVGETTLKKEVNTDRLVGWYLDRPLICDSVPLGRLVEILNKKYAAHIVLGRKELNDLPLTAVFPRQPIDNILTVIAATFDLSIDHENGSITLQ